MLQPILVVFEQAFSYISHLHFFTLIFRQWMTKFLNKVLFLVQSVLNYNYKCILTKDVKAATLIVGERGSQVLEKLISQKNFVTDCRLLQCTTQHFFRLWEFAEDFNSVIHHFFHQPMNHFAVMLQTNLVVTRDMPAFT